MWARAELRARWQAWLLLGILAGVTVGVAAAGWAGARRTERAVPDAVACHQVARPRRLLANDPAFGPSSGRRSRRLPGVTETYPLLVGVWTHDVRAQGPDRPRRGLPRHRELDADPHRARWWPAAARSRAAPTRRVDENIRDRFGLDIGSTMVIGQDAAAPARTSRPQIEPAGGVDQLPPADEGRRHRASRCRATRTGRRRADSYDKYGEHMAALVNEFVTLRDGRAGIPAFTKR